MHQKLRTLDMNLLLVFETIYRHRQVTSAASELAISPSALSHALSRLRTTLGDDLFVRQGSMMQPTARAQVIAPGILAALNALSDTLNSAEVFNPQTSTQMFRFAVTDYTAAVFFPALITRLQQIAPGVSVKPSTQHTAIRLKILRPGKSILLLVFSRRKPGISHGSAPLNASGIIMSLPSAVVIRVFGTNLASGSFWMRGISSSTPGMKPAALSTGYSTP